jgi:pyruvate-formate lyase-activating enzyme
LNFRPTASEIAEIILHHVTQVNESVASFGQGCEGEPLMRAQELAMAVRMVREKTSRGTIHLNTNGSLPEKLKALMSAGLDSVRVSLNSPTEKYYSSYFRMSGYNFQDVQRSISLALEAGIFVSLNLFFMPGFTDMESEAESLLVFLKKFPVHMIQTRNLNMDPDYYLDTIGFEESRPIGIRNLLSLLKREFPALKIGYYNPPKESF